MERTAELDCDTLGPAGQKFFEFASKRMRGQDKAIRRLAKAVDHAESPFRAKDKPIYTVLLVGGTGSGKSLLPKLLAEFWFKNPDGMINMKCSEFQNTNFTQNTLNYSDYAYQFNHGPHKESLKLNEKLVIEYSELLKTARILHKSEEVEEDPKKRKGIVSEISQLEKKIELAASALQTHQTETRPIISGLRSILVLDHIECADSDIQEALYDMLEIGECVMYVQQEGYRKVSLANSVIFITCSDWVNDLDSAKPKKGLLGFVAGRDKTARSSNGKNTHLSGMAELKEYLSPKILSRIVRVEFFRSYTEEVRLEILELLINNLGERLVKEFPVFVKISDDVKKFIVKEASDHSELGIRLLKRKFDKYITWKIENLAQKGLIKSKDYVEVSLHGKLSEDNARVIFRKINSTGPRLHVSL